jgi:hypothetical protein
VTDADCRAYLLGRLSPAEAEALEERLLRDDEAFHAMEGAEDDLFDDFARGRLGAEERTRFLERFGAQPQRVAFARALARRLGTESRSTTGRSPWIPLAAAAALVAAIAGGWWLRQRPASIDRAATAAAGSPAPVVPAAPPVVALFTLGTSRAAADAVTVTIPAASPALQVRIRLNPADRYDSYALELRSSADRVVWRGDDLHAVREAGDLVLTAQIPAPPLDNGTYELAVRGGRDDLGFLPVRIMRTP